MLFLFSVLLVNKALQYIIGVDIGTTHCKVVVMSRDGEVLYGEKSLYPFKKSSVQSEQDVDIVWQTVLGILSGVFSRFKEKIAAVSFSSAMHGVMAVDDGGKPLTPVYTWADNRSYEYAKEISSEDQKTLYQETGTPVHPMSPLCKIIWLRNQYPAVFQSANKFISIKEYIFHKLFGKYIIDHSIASATGLFDSRAGIWSSLALHLTGIDPEQLSTPVPVTHAEYELREEYKKIFGVKSKVAFIIGASDGCLANLGSGVISEGVAALTIGTSGAVRITTSAPVKDKAMRLFSYVLDSNYFVVGGPVNNGGNVVKWFKENFLIENIQGDEAYFDFAAGSPVGSKGLLFLPYIFGERAPVWDAAASGAFIGLHQQHDKADMARAVLEGICFAMKEILLAIEESTGPVTTIHAGGAVVTSPFWLQMLADVLNKPVIVASQADASVTGACYLAMLGMGWIDKPVDVKKFIKEHGVYKPSGNSEIYPQLFDIYKSLYPALKGSLHKLYDLNNGTSLNQLPGINSK